MDIISVKNLTKSYKQTQVLKGISFSIKRGSVYALLGSNGAGKTTTVNILSTLLSPDEGDVTIDGYDLKTRAKEIRRHISLTGQYAAIDDVLTGTENMLMIGALSRLPMRVVRERTSQLLQQFDLDGVADQRVSTYSGGMRRKLDLALSLLASPAIIFLDEPTTGLDPRSRQELWRIIRKLVKDGTTILLTTQYLDEADALADKISVLNDGRIVAEGTPSDLKRQVGSDYIELDFKDVSQYEAARVLLKNSVTNTESARSLLVPVTTHVSELRTLLNILSDNHIEPKSLTIRKTTLDDVFMKLTGETKKKETR